MNYFPAVHLRSGGHCEAMVKVRGVFTRCGKRASEVHHRLTRSRGGELLDSIGETVHLTHLCTAHHIWVHSNIARATDGGLYVQGQAFRMDGRVVYLGSDHQLTMLHGAEVDYDQVRQPREGVGHLA